MFYIDLPIYAMIIWIIFGALAFTMDHHSYDRYLQSYSSHKATPPKKYYETVVKKMGIGHNPRIFSVCF